MRNRTDRVARPAGASATPRARLSRLFPWCRRRLLCQMPLAAGTYLFEPKIVVLLGPIYIHSACAHCLECALHADRADINVTEHGSDEQHRDDAVGYLGVLHGLNVRAVEWKHQ